MQSYCFLPPLHRIKNGLRTSVIEAGTDAALGLAGVSLLNAADNPLVISDLKLKRKAEGVKPTIGIKTKVEWSVFGADNSTEGRGEDRVLNSENVPLLFEICLSHNEGKKDLSILTDQRPTQEGETMIIQ